MELDDLDELNSNKNDQISNSSIPIPECPHGPMFLFTKYGKNKSIISKYYACSAFRSKRDCEFSVKNDEEMSNGKQKFVKHMKSKLPKVNIKLLQNRLNKIKSKIPIKRRYCHTCNEFVLCAENHKDHDILVGIGDELIETPTKLLYAKQNSKSESQYHFDNDTVDTLLNIIIKNNRKYVLCIGTPSIFEIIRTDSRFKDIQGILMDIDHRYYNFYTEEDFLWFNMFNGFFFQNENSLKYLSKFVQNKDVMVIIDPPFGAKFEPLAETVKMLERIHLEQSESLTYFDVMLISPYFREKEILNVFPLYHMSDYKVNYANHKSFQSGGRKQGSPIRIFTSLEPQKVPLPISENYWFCKPCKGWKFQDNKHCNSCRACTSKNGATYTHCQKCNSCVKPSWSHCNTCKQCCHPSHTHNHDTGNNPIPFNYVKRKQEVFQKVAKKQRR